MPSPFLFELDSEMWRINHERCGLIFGPAAAILQIAHPRIAQGVAEHSDFRNDTLGRLRRTLAATNGIAFGTVAEAEAIRDRIQRVHTQVRGTVSRGISGPKKYSAFEPDLLLWVLATLVMASVQGWQTIYGKLPLERRENFYRDMLRFGSYFGVRPQDCPTSWRDFSHYYDDMIHGDQLGSHPLCAKLCHHIIQPTATFGTRLLGHSVRFLIVETFPEALREKMALKSSVDTRLKMNILEKSAPHIFPNLPRSQRLYPEAIQRLALQSQQRR